MSASESQAGDGPGCCDGSNAINSRCLDAAGLKFPVPRQDGKCAMPHGLADSIRLPPPEIRCGATLLPFFRNKDLRPTTLGLGREQLDRPRRYRGGTSSPGCCSEGREPPLHGRYNGLKSSGDAGATRSRAVSMTCSDWIHPGPRQRYHHGVETRPDRR